MSHDPHDAAVAAHAPKTPEPKRARVAKTVAFVALSLAALVFFTQAFDDAEVTVGSPRPDTVIDEPAGEEPPVAPEPEPEPESAPLTAESLSLEVVFDEVHCFGSAGCNVAWHLEVSHDGTEFDQDTPWEVQFELRGQDDGTYISTFGVLGDSYETADGYSSIPTEGTDLTATVLRVTEDR